MTRDTIWSGGGIATDLEIWRSAARQQPAWEDTELVQQVREELAELPALVASHEVSRLRSLLAEVAAGRSQVIQAGDCAEDPAECTPGPIARKVRLIDTLAGVMIGRSGRPVVRVGRIAGQFGKPRSSPTERVGDVELPVFRGHMVNDPEPDRESRRPDPKRILHGYWAASAAMDLLRATEQPATTRVWTSHEALLLDYEVPMLRRVADGSLLLTSTHWPWIGDRTRQVDGAHIELLAEVSNPVACKVGPSMTVDELLAVCERLDPKRQPGRLTLIARMGAARVADTLPALVAAATGWPAIWLCDPMHGNTITARNGAKTRLMSSVIHEVEVFHAVVTAAGAVAGGLHLEVTPDDVTECVADEAMLDGVAAGEIKYSSLCDPRLNPRQAIDVVAAWRG